jgi:hypothetical protein
MNRDLFWTSLMTKIASQGAISYNELKRLDIEEFFLLVMDYEKTINSGKSHSGNKGAD